MSIIPENEKWFHTPENKKKVERALEWLETSERKDNFDEFIKQLAKDAVTSSD